jgi:hypothetical protein
MAEKTEKLEFHPDAWARFERATKIVAKSPPKPRKGAEKKKSKKRGA